jgi:hypothetical protein
VLFQSLVDELMEVEVEGWQVSALRSTFTSMRAMEPARSINMLPLFDPLYAWVGLQ